MFSYYKYFFKKKTTFLFAPSLFTGFFSLILNECFVMKIPNSYLCNVCGNNSVIIQVATSYYITFQIKVHTTKKNECSSPVRNTLKVIQSIRGNQAF